MPLLNVKYPPEFLNLCQILIKNAQFDIIPEKYSVSKMIKEFINSKFGNPNLEFEIPLSEDNK